MADGFTVEVSGLNELMVQLTLAGAKVVPAADAVVAKAALNVKDGMAEDAAKSPHFKRMAASMSYDSAYRVGAIRYEVGPDADRGSKKSRGAAHLAGIAYFGGANGGGGQLDLEAPLKREEPQMLKALGDALADLL